MNTTVIRKFIKNGSTELVLDKDTISAIANCDYAKIVMDDGQLYFELNKTIRQDGYSTIARRVIDILICVEVFSYYHESDKENFTLCNQSYHLDCTYLSSAMNLLRTGDKVYLDVTYSHEIENNDKNTTILLRVERGNKFVSILIDKATNRTIEYSAW